MQIKPDYIRKNLLSMGYSEESSIIIASQYAKHPANRNRWGTEEQTRRDIETIKLKWNNEIIWA